jgi:N2-(2-carboxyethyl)arginine synthase
MRNFTLKNIKNITNMKASKFFLQCTAKLGITNIFGIVGGEAQAIQFDEVPELNFYLTRHEFAAGIMADTFGRISGRPQMCYSTFGPGLTNLSTGACSAILDRSPMIVVSAQIHRKEIRFNQTHQCIDNVAMMRTLTKFAIQIESVYEIPLVLQKAALISLEGIPGPVYISFPIDVMEEDIEDSIAATMLEAVETPVASVNNALNTGLLNHIIKKINSARQPLIVIGNQVIRDGCCTELIAFAEKTNIPCIVTLASKGAIPDDHPLLITPCNKYIDKIYGQDLLSGIFDKTDLLLLFGYDFGEDLKSGLWSKNSESIVINSFYESMGKVYEPDLVYLGNLKTALGYLLQSDIAPKSMVNDIFAARERLFMRKPIIQEGKTDIAAIIHSVRNIIGKNGIFCSDIGLHKQYAGLLSLSYLPNTFMCSNVCGSFGFGLPAAMGTQLAMPGVRVCALCGDGGFHSTSQDLETAVRYNIPVGIIILKDNAFGLIKYYQHLERDVINKESVEFGNVDFVKLAEANGMSGQHLQNIEELENVIEKGYQTGKPFLIEIPVEYDYQFKSQ